jgi:hypothetical protein
LAAQECTPLAAAPAPAGAMRAGAALVRSAEEELRPSAGLDAAGIKERLALVHDRSVQAAGRRAGKTTGLLATIGAAAPFVGLFGTVWGIMNAFIGISRGRPPTLLWSRPASPRHCWRPPERRPAQGPLYRRSEFRGLRGCAAAEIARYISRMDAFPRCGEMRPSLRLRLIIILIKLPAAEPGRWEWLKNPLVGAG